MKIDVTAVRKTLKAFDFKTLFYEHLGWDKHTAHLDIPVGDRNVQLDAIAQKRGFVAFVCDSIPDRQTRLKIDHQVTKSVREHFVIYADEPAGQQVWHWVRRETGKPLASRDHRFDVSQSGDPLIQRLEHIAVSMEEEEALTLPDIADRGRAAFDVDKVTKKFYERFKAEHSGFLKLIKGFPAPVRRGGKAEPHPDLQWYTSLMLNRLMFVYFMQKKGFLDGDTDYLRNRLEMVKVDAASHRVGTSRDGSSTFFTFYRYFLLRLFHDGLGTALDERKLEPIMKKLLGKIPFLNGGFFEVHKLETEYPDIDIPDEAFGKLFDFFDLYSWHLDERPCRADNEINPDVVGYIFEKYINQKQMGAYYTKEDITEYISKNTIIPYLFDAAQKKCSIAFKPESDLWRLLQDDPDRYIYPAVGHGVTCDYDRVNHRDHKRRSEPLSLPPEIEAGIKDVSKRDGWNKTAPPEYGLPTETWREVVARRQRCIEIREKLRKGEVWEINELITLNLDIWQFARDAIVNAEGPELLRAFWHTLAGRMPEKSNEQYEPGITVLDPTCGSGAFLFAALRILETLYSDCLERMERFVEDDKVDAGSRCVSSTSRDGSSTIKYRDFRHILDQIGEHRGERPACADASAGRYFILKSIIINNLFGVDIMEEAVEICKLRLFLKLVAQVEPDNSHPHYGLEPLPDIDFNIRAGNTLVGFASLDQVKKSMEGDMLKLLELPRIEEEAEIVDQAFQQFRRQQTEHGGKVTAEDKKNLRDKLAKLDDELDRYLASEYGIIVDEPSRLVKTKRDASSTAFDAWKASHQPFHWLVEFYGIMDAGGFDVIIGNPPYVATSKVNYLSREAQALRISDLYGHVLLRLATISSHSGRSGMIVPLSITFSEDFGDLRSTLTTSSKAWFSSFDNIPAAIFAGVSQRCTIWLGGRSASPSLFTTQMHRWRSVTRFSLMANISYTDATAICDAAQGIPRIPNARLVPFVNAVRTPEGCRRDMFTRTSRTQHIMGFAPAARNFVSAFGMPPPCLDDSTLTPVPASGQGSIGLTNERDIAAVVAAVVGDCFFTHWLIWGDGFHVTAGVVSSFVRALEHVPMLHLEALRQVGECIISRRHEALVFKRNAGKYVGNFNYRLHAALTRRSDLVFMAALGMKRPDVMEVFAHTERVLAINEHAGEKAIPASVRAKYPPHQVNLQQERRALRTADQIITKHFGFSVEELECVVTQQIKDIG